MEKNCEKCCSIISLDTELYTVCEGRCAKYFHANCVGVSEADLCAFSKNIIWLCDPCMTLFCRTRERMTADISTSTDQHKFMDVEGEILQLKSAVAEIVKTFADVRKSDPVARHRHSTPVSSPKATYDDYNEIACCSSQTENGNESGEFSLYLTNIDNSATESDISLLVSRSLRVPLSSCNDVVKLVPKWKNVNQMEYVSFKVVLKSDMKLLALQASTWPKEIKYREFKHRMNDTWKPR